MQKHGVPSGEWFDVLKGLMMPGPHPVPIQRLTMEFHPFNKKTQGSLGEGPCDQAGFDLDQDFLPGSPPPAPTFLDICPIRVAN